MILAQIPAVAALEVDQRLSFAIGGLSLFILLGLLVALVAFGGGREHS
jgi:hypothetical protein